MNTLKLVLAASSLIVASSVIACTGTTEDAASSESNATADIDHMFKRPDGTFDVTCSDGRTFEAVTVEAIRADDVCNAPAANSCLAAEFPAAAVWKEPAPASNACSDAEIDAIVAAQDQGLGAMKAAATTPACAACAFSAEGDANWGPIVTTGNDAFWLNYALGLARAPAGSMACAEAWFQRTECEAEMCNTCDAKAGHDADACATEASTEAHCGRYNLDAACGDYKAAEKQSADDLKGLVKANCGVAPTQPVTP